MVGTWGYVIIGIQVFMCLYGLSLYMETTPELRKGRRRYIIISFVLVVMSSIPTGMDAWLNYQYVFLSATGGKNYSDAVTTVDGQINNWFPPLYVVILTMGMVTGECLMVGTVSMPCVSPQSLFRIHTNIVNGWIDLQMFHYLEGKVVGYHFPFHGTCGIIKYAFGNYFQRNIQAYCLVSGPVYTCIKLAKNMLDPATRPSRIPIIIMTAVNVSANITSTTLILVKLIRARRKLAKALPNMSISSAYGGVVSILVESAAPVALFGTCVLITEIVWIVVDTYASHPQEASTVNLLFRINSAGFIFEMLYYSFGVSSRH